MPLASDCMSCSFMACIRLLRSHLCVSSLLHPLGESRSHMPRLQTSVRGETLSLSCVFSVCLGLDGASLIMDPTCDLERDNDGGFEVEALNAVGKREVRTRGKEPRMQEKESAVPPGSRFHSNGCSDAASIEPPSSSVNFERQWNRPPFDFSLLIQHLKKAAFVHWR